MQEQLSVTPSIAPWEEATITNSLMFRLVMEQPGMCKQLLECLLDTRIVSISPIPRLKAKDFTTEKDIRVNPRSKGIRLDIFIKSADGTAINVEMQAENLPPEEIGKRARYYQSVMDMSLLQKGKNVHYASLAKSVIIFICTYDPFGHGLAKYSFSNLCHQNHTISMQDDALKIFFNANGDLHDLTEAQRHFLAFAKDGNPRNSFTEKLAEHVAYMQLSHEKRGVYMTYQQELLGREIRGEKRGEIRGREQGILIGEKRGITIGEKRGITIGEEKVSKLYAYLSTKGLVTEMQRAFVDKEYRARLVKQYAAQIT